MQYIFDMLIMLELVSFYIVKKKIKKLKTSFGNASFRFSGIIQKK